MANIVQRNVQGACDHQGTATPTVAAENVRIKGQAILTVPTSFTVAGCTLNASGSPVPCVALMFQQGATKVRANGMPVLLDNATPQANGPLGIQGSGSLKGVQSTVSAK